MTEQTQPWAEQTVEVSPQQGGFRRGVASVSAPTRRNTDHAPAAPHEPTGVDWPAVEEPRQTPPGYYVRQWRVGRHWSAIGGLFAFVCWGIWAISDSGDLSGPIMTFVLSLLVAVGLFALCRLVGRVVWERQFGRMRRGAVGAHLVTGVFLVGVGIAYLRQTEWVITAWNWVTSF